MGSNGCTVKEVVFVPYGECVKEEGAHALSGFVENLGHVVLVREPHVGGDVDELDFTSLSEVAIAYGQKQSVGRALIPTHWEKSSSARFEVLRRLEALWFLHSVAL